MKDFFYVNNIYIQNLLSEHKTFILRARAATIFYQKSPYLFFPYLERMYSKYLPCQILSHDFNEKCDFLNNEFSIRFPAITQFKNGLLQKRELGSRRDVTSYNQTLKRPDGIIFSKPSVGKNTRRRINIALLLCILK